MHQDIYIFTDGACKGNPGPGGWGAIIVRCPDFVKEIGGHIPNTTNNQMEMLAAISALKDLNTEARKVRVFTDSNYLVQGMKSWIHGWKRKNWVNTQKKPVANKELWLELDQLSTTLTIEWHHVRGHSGHPGNERADSIASSFALNTPPTLYKGPKSEYPIQLSTP
ncbi:MAG: ribonuclease HI [Zetaproteobacteria bacterium]|nr:ribonuclease HI [Zetaproteobacteria bacterium]